MKSRKNRKFAHGLSSKEFLSKINSTYGLKITPNQFVTVVLNLEKGKYNVDPLQDFLHMFLYTNPLIASKCILQNIFQSKGCISCKNGRRNLY